MIIAPLKLVEPVWIRAYKHTTPMHQWCSDTC